jgi:hypothetical protein
MLKLRYFQKLREPVPSNESNQVLPEYETATLANITAELGFKDMAVLAEIHTQ